MPFISKNKIERRERAQYQAGREAESMETAARLENDLCCFSNEIEALTDAQLEVLLTFFTQFDSSRICRTGYLRTGYRIVFQTETIRRAAIDARIQLALSKGKK